MTAIAPLDHRSRVAAQRRVKMRTSLLNAALELVARVGPDSISIDAIVAQAQVSRGTFYKYFSAPNEVIRALGLDLAAELISAVDDVVCNQSDPAAQAAYGMRAVLNYVADFPLLGAFIVRAGWPISEPGHAFFQFVGPNIDRGLASGRFRGLSRATALTLMGGLCVGAIHDLMQQSQSADFIEEVAATLLRGLGLDASEAHRLAHAELILEKPQPKGILAQVGGVKGTSPASA